MKCPRWNLKSWSGDIALLAIAFDLDKPIGWIGACSKPEHSGDFAKAFESADVRALRTYQDREGDILFVLAGTSAKSHDQNILLLARSPSGIYADDEIIGIVEVSALPEIESSLEAGLTEEVERQLPQKRTIFREVLKAFFSVKK